jgi:hypothetical protein
MRTKPASKPGSSQAPSVGARVDFSTSMRADFRFAPLNILILVVIFVAGLTVHYKQNPVALHLRAMNMVYEGLRQKGSMIIVPSTAVETMGLGALGGLTAFDRAMPEKNSSEPDAADAGGKAE